MHAFDGSQGRSDSLDAGAAGHALHVEIDGVHRFRLHLPAGGMAPPGMRCIIISIMVCIMSMRISII